MKKNKLLLLISSVGVLALLAAAAVQENFLKDWRRIQAAGRSEEGPIEVRLRQIVNPGLGVSDRCISCHAGMGPGEQGVTGHKAMAPHKPVVHDPAEYGCTVCHGGQGLATEQADAHGTVRFWPEPMTPKRYAWAGCGTCHAPLGVPEREAFEAARLAFERLDCLACHKLDGRGGLIRAGGGGMEGPDLSRSGLTGYDPAWYDKHIKKMEAAKDGPWRTSFGPISAADRELLAQFLATRVAAPDLVRAKAAFHSTGCLGCHKVSGVGGDEGPELSRAGEKDPGQMDFTAVQGGAGVADWMADHFRAPGSIVANSQMPPASLDREEVELLTLYTLSLRRRELRAHYTPRDRMRAMRFGEREFATSGATIYGAFCAGCHGAAGLGRRAAGMAAFPSVTNPDFLELASDRFLTDTIRLGRPGRRMPGWEKDGGLRPAEIAAVVGRLREMGGVAYQGETGPPRWITAAAADGQRLYESACAGCHGAKGQGGEGPALNNQVFLRGVTDRYLVETAGRGRRGTVMRGFREPSAVMPGLSEREIEAIVAFIRSWEGKKS
jgi:mono/diheme cytochrome c family protein